MKNYNKIAFLGFFFFFIGLNSCKKEELYIHNYKDIDDFKKVAQLFSVADSETRRGIIQTYHKKGIEEFLLADILKAEGLSTRYLSTLCDLNSVILENPMITIAYPSFAFHNESFEKHLSLIDYTVVVFDDPDKVESLPAFNASGQLVNISSTFDESLRYCVIKYNEAYIAVNPLTHKTYFGDDISFKLLEFAPRDIVGTYLMYSAADLFNSWSKEAGKFPSDSIDSRTSEPCNLPCERDCYKKKDELHRVKWSSKDCVKNFESGFHLPQVEMIAYYGIPRYNSGTVTVDLVAKDVFLNWKDMTTKFSEPLELEIATWTEDFGSRWQVLWIERDYWNKVQDKFTLGFSVSFKVRDPVTGSETNYGANATWEVTSMKQDKEIGRSLIEYCDKAKDKGEIYKTLSCDGSGGFWFKEHVRD